MSVPLPFVFRRYRAEVAAERERRPDRAAPVAALAVAKRSFATTIATRRRAAARSQMLRSVRIAHAKAMIRTSRGATASRLARLAKDLIDSGHPREALACWERAVELDPDRLDLYVECAGVYALQGRASEAVAIEERGVAVQNRLAQECGIARLGLEFAHSNFASVIGHIAQLDIFVKQQLLVERSLEELIFLAPGRRAQNSCYLGYWLPFFPRLISHPGTIAELHPLTRLLRPVHFQAWRGFDGQLRYHYAVSHEVQRRWEVEGRAPLLKLSEEDRERGRACLEALGVPTNAWFVGLHVREDRAHRLLDSRNADISTYHRAISAVVARGGWVIRMGDRAMTPLPPMEGVVDYVFSEAKSDWMDVFLWAEGRFLIGTESGPAGVPQTFGKPVLQTNWNLGCPYWYSGDIFLPRLYWSERMQRHLTFRETLSSPISATVLGSELARHGVRVRENTPEELEEGVLEMLDQVEGGVDSEEDQELLRRYERQEVTPWGRPTRPGGARIGRGFLRRHAELLDVVA